MVRGEAFEGRVLYCGIKCVSLRDLRGKSYEISTRIANYALITKAVP